MSKDNIIRDVICMIIVTFILMCMFSFFILDATVIWSCIYAGVSSIFSIPIFLFFRAILSDKE